MTERHIGLSPRERQIMDVLYKSGEATVADVLEGMSNPPGYSAVRATLNVLEEKGEVVHRADGRRYVYRPAVAADQARGSALRHVVQTFFDGSVELAAVALLRMSDTAASSGELQRLADRIDRARREGR